MRWGDGEFVDRRVFLTAFAAAVLVMTFAYGLTATDVPAQPAVAIDSTTDSTVAVEAYDLNGDGDAEVARIGDDVVTLPPPAEDDEDLWRWLPFVTTLIVSIVGATATIVASRPPRRDEPSAAQAEA